MKKIIRNLVFGAFCACSVYAASDSWNGTADTSWYGKTGNVSVLTTAEQLAGLAQLVNKGVSSFKGQTIVLGNDINLSSSRNWVPIGTKKNPFMGTFDGYNSHIYNLYITTFTPISTTYYVDDDYIGLFGYIVDANIKNLNLSNVEIHGGSKDYVGSLVGYAYYGSIKNVSSENVTIWGKNYVGCLGGFVESIDSSYCDGVAVMGNKIVGGLAGLVRDSISNSYVQLSQIVEADSDLVGGLVGWARRIRNSYAKINYWVKGVDSVGGLAGYVEYSIDSSYSESKGVLGRSYVGGLVGYSKNGVRFSHFNGETVLGTGAYVGGLVGWGIGMMESYAVVEDSIRGTNAVGGLVGRIRDGSIISKSYAKARVVSDYGDVGGLAGEISGPKNLSISASYFMGEILGGYYNLENPLAERKRIACIGGLAGCSDGVIDDSYAIVKLTVYEADHLIGGLAGSARTIKNSYALGNIITNEADSVGGLVGRVDTIVGSYHEGDPLFKDSVKGEMYIGGLAGFVNGNIISSFNKNTSVVGKRGVGGLAGRVNGSIVSSFDMNSIVNGDYYVGGLTGSAHKIDSSFSKDSVSAIEGVGGLAGTCGEITNSYSMSTVFGKKDVGGLKGGGEGKVEKSMALGDVYGVTNVGGLNGGSGEIVQSFFNGNITLFNDESILAEKYSVGGLVGGFANNIEESYMGGSINIAGDVDNEKVVAGCIINHSAYQSTVIKNSYYNKDKCTFDIDGNVYKFAEIIESSGLTTEEMQMQSSYTKWNFVNLWEITYMSYPYLQFFPYSLSKATVSTEPLENIIFDKTEKKPLVTSVFLEGEKLRADLDYKVIYRNNVDVGSASIYICGEIPYVGCKKIDFDIKIGAFLISFTSESEILFADSVKYGAFPMYEGDLPAKKSTEKYDYTFAGWEPSVAAVSGDANYTALFDSTLREYAITFKNEGAELQSSELPFGSEVEYLGAEPTRTATPAYTYTFAGWEPSVVTVSGDANYTAVFDSSLREYTIVFKNESEELQSSNVAYGENPEYLLGVPTKASSEKYDYAFMGWDPAVVAVSENAVYSAVFDSTLRKYSVIFQDENSELQSNNVDYGVVPEYLGNTPTKKSTDKYDYTFIGWNPSIVVVSGNAVYVAMFDSTIRSYDVSFVNGSVVLQTDNIKYGTMPVYYSYTPTKITSDSCTYVFSGWYPELKPVSGNMVYTAQFDEVKKQFTIRFKKGPYLLEKKTVVYGEIPKYTGETPMKQFDGTYSYKFAGWSPELGPITHETDYEADFIAVIDTMNRIDLVKNHLINQQLSLNVVSRKVQISAAPIGSTYALLDLQGRVLQKGRVESSNFSISVPRAGIYLIRMESRIYNVNVR